MASHTLPVISGDKDRSLQDALSRLTDSRAPLGRDADPIVTAAHRLPAIAASFAPFPEQTDNRLRGALAARGVYRGANRSSSDASVTSRLVSASTREAALDRAPRYVPRRRSTS